MFMRPFSRCYVLLRPGEQFKAKKVARRGNGNGAMDTVAVEESATATTTGADGADSAADAMKKAARVGAAACVEVKLHRRGNASPETSQPLVLRTPREAKHLVS